MPSSLLIARQNSRLCAQISAASRYDDSQRVLHPRKLVSHDQYFTCRAAVRNSGRENFVTCRRCLPRHHLLPNGAASSDDRLNRVRISCHSPIWHSKHGEMSDRHPVVRRVVVSKLLGSARFAGGTYLPRRLHRGFHSKHRSTQRFAAPLPVGRSPSSLYPNRP
jgi:hypothetical protein